MKQDIELFADTILMLLMTMVSVLLWRIDPMLPSLWVAATCFMTLQHH